MRTRINDQRYTDTVTRYTKSSAGATPVPSSSSALLGQYKRIDDCCTPRYQKTVQSGGVLPYLPVSISTTEKTGQPLDYTLTNVSGTPWTPVYGPVWLAEGTYCPSITLPATDPAIIAYVTNAAISDAKSGAWDALTSFAEAGKTASGIARSVNRVFDIATRFAYQARTMRRNGSYLSKFSELWLEGRYQWRPLLYDINSAMKAFEEGDQLRKEGRSNGRQDVSVSTIPKVTTQSSGILTGTSVATGSRAYRGFGLAVGTISAVESRPLQTGWELIPFSFVVDWFVDIGNAINAWTPIPGVETKSSGYSIKLEWNLEQTISIASNPANPSGVITQAQQGIYRQTITTYTRVPSGAVLPSLYPRLNTLKLVDIAAIALQRFRRISRLL